MSTRPVSVINVPSRPALDGPRPSFSRALWRIASADVSCGNVVTLLRDGAAFDAMLALIDSAKETLDFEGYIFRQG